MQHSVEKYSKIDQFLSKITENLIYDIDCGYVLYNKYLIKKDCDLYLIGRYSDGSIRHFLKLRHATAWCILDRYNKIYECNKVLELDRGITSLNAEIQNHRRLQRIGTLESKEINRDKYLVALDKQKRFRTEIDKYIILAKKCQDKGYQNELTRTAR